MTLLISASNGHTENKETASLRILALTRYWRYKALIFRLLVLADFSRSVAQPGRALSSGGRGRRCKSSHPDHSKFSIQRLTNIRDGKPARKENLSTRKAIDNAE